MKKQLLLAAALTVAAVVSSQAQGTVGFNNGTTSKITTNSIENNISSGVTAGGATAYYYALFYTTTGNGSATVGGSTSAVAGQGSASYAFQDSNWSFAGDYGTNTAAAGRFISTSADANGNTTVQGVAGGSSAQFVVIGWSANIGSTVAAMEAWYADPSMTGWIGESVVGGAVSTGAGLGFPPGLFGAASPYITGFTLGEVVTTPEPSTIALIGLGAAGLAMIRRRK